MNSLIFSVLTLSLVTTAFAADTTPALIPAPAKAQWRNEAFILGLDVPICADIEARAAGELLANRLRKSTGYAVKINRAPADGSAVKGAILLTTMVANKKLGDEGYEIAVERDSIVIRAPQPAGVFYGTQTLLQLLPPEFLSPQTISRTACQIPCVRIEDQPRFKWRGLMLDVSRHFFTKAEVERLLDEMALHKLNTLHWHLVDDQGWRIEIKKYPKLTQVGAWRAATGFGLDAKASTNYDAEGRYGGFYTQDDIRDVVKYAAARHITIVPEIEMPGHSSAALSAYPEFSCTGGPFEPPLVGGVFNGIYCPGNDETFQFMEDVLTEVFQLFPGKYIHVGGDEVPTTNWANCTKCQALVKREGFQKTGDLEGYFVRRMEQFIDAHGRTLIGWSEIREGGLGPNAAIMDWSGGAVEAASEGHDVVMSPLNDCYFDHYQSKDQSTEPHAIGGYLPLRQVYDFEPLPAKLASQYQSHILGAEACVWTEYMPNFSHVEYMVFPRLCALAEVAWSPKASRNWNDFERRLQKHYARLDALGVHYRHTDLNAPDTAAVR